MSSNINFQVIADSLNTMRCSIHGKTIHATVEGEHINLGESCCDKFQQEINAEFNRQQDLQTNQFDFRKTLGEQY